MISGITRSFTRRKPWVAVLMATILGPYVAMWWLGKAKIALLYLFAFLALCCPPYIFAAYQVPETNTMSDIFFSTYILAFFIYIIGIFHSVSCARIFNPDKPTPYYAHWYVVIIFAAITCFVTYYEEIMQGHFFYRIPSSDMAPSLCKGEHFFVDYYARGIVSPGTVAWPPKRGDMVMIEHKDVRYVSRIIGLPGENIQIKQGILFIDDQEVETEAVWFDEICDTTYTETNSPHYWETLPNGTSYPILHESKEEARGESIVYPIPNYRHYFVLQDHRRSPDCSHCGTISNGIIPEHYIKGKMEPFSSVSFEE